MLLIPEVGHNWNGNIQTAKNIILACRDSGLSIVKFQLYDTDKIKKPGETNYEELKRSELTYGMMMNLKEFANNLGIEFLCSVFDLDRLSWYMETQPKCIKIASRSIFDTELIDACQQTGLPMIISTAVWNEPKLPNYKADYLFCLTRRQILRDGVTGFPEKFDSYRGYAGFSDHCIGFKYCYEAVDRGASIIEKHVTLDRNWPGWDQPSSGLPAEFGRFITDIGEKNG